MLTEFRFSPHVISIHYEDMSCVIVVSDFDGSYQPQRTPLLRSEKQRDNGGWVTLNDVRPGAVFVTQDGVHAVKSDNRYNEFPYQWQCVLLESGEYVHFEAHNTTLVREVKIEYY